MSFTYSDAGVVTQSDLSSGYTTGLTAYLQTAEGADFAAFLAYSQLELTITQALEVKAQILSGDFSLSGLFGAAQSKTGAVDGDQVANPVPMLTVGTTSVSLVGMLGGLDTYTWQTTTKSGTVYHTREFFAAGKTPDDYDANWWQEPVLTEYTGTGTLTFSLTNPSLDDNELIFLNIAGWQDHPDNFIFGTATVTVVGDIDRSNETVDVSMENGSDYTFTLGISSGIGNLEPNKGLSSETTDVPLTFNSVDNYIAISWDSDDEHVGMLESISGTINYTYSYWA